MLAPNTPLLDIEALSTDDGGAHLTFQFGVLRLTTKLDAHQLLHLLRALSTDKRVGFRAVPAEASLPITGWFCPDLPSPTKYFSLTTEQLNPRRTT